MLPGPYERWFVEMCGRPSPVESRSTCDDCAMLPGAPELPPEGPFDPAARCCTYHPHLAPHFVGGILIDGTETGRAIVRARIAARAGVTPIGLGATPEQAAAYQRLAGVPGGFGRGHEVVCSFYDNAQCTVWRHRGAACAGFHCKLDRGALSASLWSLLIVGFNAVERALARWLLERQGLDAAAADALLHAPRNAALDARAWGDWRGREEYYFISAARLIEPLSWAEVAAIGGRAVAGLDDAIRRALAAFDAPPPDRVRRNPEILHQLGPTGGVRLQNRALPFDLLEVSLPLADRLARATELDLSDLGLAPELTRRLLDWQVLVPTEK